MSRLVHYLSKDETYNILLSSIKDGNIFPDCSLKDYYEIFVNPFFSEKEDLKAALFFAIKAYERFQDFSLLSTFLDISENTLKKLFKSDYKKATFPIVDNHEGDLANLYIVEVEDEIPLSFPNSEPSRLNYLKNIKNALNENFFIFFDKYFTGRSFGLAVAACFYISDDAREKFVFTGEIRADGKVYQVDCLESKVKMALARNKYLVSSRNIAKISDLANLNKTGLNVPFVQLFGKTKADLDKNFIKLKKYMPDDIMLLDVFGFNQEDLSVFTESYLSNDIDNYGKYLKEFYSKVKKLYETNLDINLHIMGSLSSFAFLMGIILGAKRKYAIYHYQDGEIYQVYNFINQSARKLKAKKEKFDYIRYNYQTIDSDSTELMVSIYVASHNPKRDAAIFAEKKLKCNMIEIELKNNQGDLPIDNQDLWVEIVREIYSICDNPPLEIKNNIERYHIVFSAPVPIALALGMAIGDYKKISVYNFDKQMGTYKMVFDSDLFGDCGLKIF